MTSPRVIPDDVLAPISEQNPVGVDLRESNDWVEFKKARPKANEAASKDIWEREDNASWPLLKELSTRALATKSKDLQLAVWLLEASLKTDGFAGVRDGLRTIRELLEKYWAQGLYPSINNGDVESRLGPLSWLNEKLADAIREIPLTSRREPATNYSQAYYKAAYSGQGGITREEFEAAARDSLPESLLKIQGEFNEAREELSFIEDLLKQKLEIQAVSLAEAKTAFDDCKTAVNSIVRKNPNAAKQPAAPSSNGTPAPESPVPGELVPSDVRFNGGFTASSGESWGEAEQLVREGKLDDALTRMSVLAAKEPNGRARFQRKLLLANICLRTKRVRLAKSILEELADIIDRHQLEQWETAEFIGAVWTSLYRCCRDEAAGKNDVRASELFARLCRLDPWQALACGEQK
jgi:type VI secretion system protein ImpA